jgi:hypothetical protein
VEPGTESQKVTLVTFYSKDTHTERPCRGNQALEAQMESIFTIKCHELGTRGPRDESIPTIEPHELGTRGTDEYLYYKRSRTRHSRQGFSKTFSIQQRSIVKILGC